MINYRKLTEDCVQWIRDWFDKNGKNCNAVIGLSGGKDSTVVAGLCVEALGKERVIGVSMPEANQGLNDADKIAAYFGIPLIVSPIGLICEEFYATPQEMQYLVPKDGELTTLGPLYDNKWSLQSSQNIAPRVRMTILYAIAQSCNGRVMGTCNASENLVGYFTRWGDGASDVEPIGSFTVNDVKEIGRVLGIPDKWVEKIPDDGLQNSMPDDEKFKKWGFSYKYIEDYIKNGTTGNKEVDEILKNRRDKNLFKLSMPPIFYPK